MRIVLIEISHWHFSLYQQALRDPAIEIIGVSDIDYEKSQEIAAYFGCPAYENYKELLALPNIDFAFAFGRHADMPQIAKDLISYNIPFAIEKPCGLNSSQVDEVRRLANQANLYVAVPFVFRLIDLSNLVSARDDGLPSPVSHLEFRNIAGPPQRYIDNGNAWMLNPAISGGGCIINLAVHFIDLSLILTNSTPLSIYSAMNSRSYGTAVEDYALITLLMTDGAICTIETGYTFPSTREEKREFTITSRTANEYVRTITGGIRRYHETALLIHSEDKILDFDSDPLYARFVERALTDYQVGKSPMAGLADLTHVMEVVDAAYSSARNNEIIFL